MKNNYPKAYKEVMEILNFIQKEQDFQQSID